MNKTFLMKASTLQKIKTTKKWAVAYAFILPSFALLLLFHIIPILMSVFYSFHDYNAVQAPIFTGLKNYQRMITDPFVSASLFNTVFYSLLVVPAQTVISMVLAYVLARKCNNRWGQFTRSALFIPVITSMIMATAIWRILLSGDGGVVNTILQFFGFSSVNWLGQRWPSLIAVCIIAVWKNVGYFLVIFYAGMMDVPTSLYEAATVDGANSAQQFLKITLPILKPITYLVITLGTIWSFQVFDLVYTLTGGGPGRSTVTLVLTIYNAAFKEYKMGYASAISTFLLVIVLAVSMLQKFVLGDKSNFKLRRKSKNENT
ncbi:MAG: sugar ABC transporter permease [Oscillospiraceae bacterium]